MRKLGYILLLSLPFFGAGCQQNTGSENNQGAGANNPQYKEGRETGAGRVEESGMGPGVSNDGGSMDKTATDSMSTPGAVGATEAARATEKTRTQAGSSQTKGEKGAGKTQE